MGVNNYNSFIQEDSNDFFEGVEKKMILKFDFGCSQTKEFSLRSISPALWDKFVLQPLGCNIIKNVVHGPRFVSTFDSYVLSESSFFVYNDQIILKTCGVTRLCLAPFMATNFLKLLLIDLKEEEDLLKLTHDEIYEIAILSKDSPCSLNLPKDLISSILYMHLSYLKPELQLPPYGSFTDEVAALRLFHQGGETVDLKGGTDHVLHFYYNSRKPLNEIRPTFSSVELLMFGIEPESLERFIGTPEPRPKKNNRWCRTILSTNLPTIQFDGSRSIKGLEELCPMAVDDSTFTSENCAPVNVIDDYIKSISTQKSFHVAEPLSSSYFEEPLDSFSFKKKQYIRNANFIASSFATTLTKDFTITPSERVQMWEKHFTPYGYSCNVDLGHSSYLTVHISPEVQYGSLEVSSLKSTSLTLLEMSPHMLPLDSQPLRSTIKCLDPKEIHLFQITDCAIQLEKAARGFPPIYKMKNEDKSFSRTSFQLTQCGPWHIVYCVYRSKINICSNQNAFAVSEAVQKIVEESGNDFIQVPEGTRDPMNFIAQSVDSQQATHVLNLNSVVTQLTRWRANLNFVTPYYAVKCNSDPMLLTLLARLGCGFDCASVTEVEMVAHLVDCSTHIIYSNPCKDPAGMKGASQMGIRLSVFDNKEEILKAKKFTPETKQLLRIRTDDKGSQCPMSGKFGAADGNWISLLELAVEVGVDVVGVHFHVGSGCTNAGAFAKSIENAKKVFDYGFSLGLDMHILDIGGGFPGEFDDYGLFEDMSREIISATNKFFENFERLKKRKLHVIAEPGRFFASSCSTLLLDVIAVRDPAIKPESSAITQDCTISVDLSNADEGALKENTDSSYLYYVNDSLYGSFNCVIFDHAKLRPPKVISSNNGQAFPSMVFGQTCDGIDFICSCSLPRLSTGDRLAFYNMGAYTISAASAFNGFDCPRTVYTFFD
eukprot:GHVP01051507.1.p1 GENE.GHVP01051507.1~~GHVP01051507.1.p1  ORF type:complete len:940 (+),score=162.60 GHVP01051507.1:117-2936(+)